MSADDSMPDDPPLHPDDASPGSAAAVASAAALVAADDGHGHVHPLLTQLSEQQMASVPAHLAGRSHSDVRPPTSISLTSLSSGALIDIPAVPEADLPPPEPTTFRELHSIISDSKNDRDLALSHGAAAVDGPQEFDHGDHGESSRDGAALAVASLAQLPAPAPLTSSDGRHQSAPPLQPQHALAGYDWPTFVAAYAAGRWNPHRIPSAPRPSAASTPTTPGISLTHTRRPQESVKGSSGSSMGTVVEALSLPTSPPHLSPPSASGPGTGTDSSASASDFSNLSRVSASSVPSSIHSSASLEAFTPQPVKPVVPISAPMPIAPEPPPQISSSLPPSTPSFPSIGHRRASIGSPSTRENAMRIPLPPPSFASSGTVNTPHHLRNAVFSPFTHPSGSHLQPLVPVIATPGSPSQHSAYFSAFSTMPSGATTPDLATAAATMRWAASSHVSLSPLTLPSPEHELTDPIRGVNVTLPVDDIDDEEEGSSDNGTGSRKWANLGVRTGKQRGGRRGRYYGKGRTPSQTRRIWEKFTSGEIHQSSSEETEMGKSDDDSNQHLPSEPRSRRRDGRISNANSQLPTIEASPLTSPVREAGPGRSPVREESTGNSTRGGDDIQRTHSGHSGSRSSSMPAPASAPLLRAASEDDVNSSFVQSTDYFGLAIRRDPQVVASPSRGLPGSPDTKDSRGGESLVKHLEAVAERDLDSSSQSVSSLPISSSSRTSEGSIPSEQSTISMHPPRSDMLLSVPRVSSLSVPSTPAQRGVLSRQSSSPLPVRIDNVDDEGIDDDAASSVHVPTQTASGRRATFDSGRLRVGSSASVGGKVKVSTRPGLTRTQSMKVVGSGHGLMRVTREEDEFNDRGYLVPPFPRDENERRRALRKFNIVHTMPDVNFDRIAYLTKLVFSTKIVVVSLVDEEEEWFKMESGMGLNSLPRDVSFSAHAVLQKGDEPTVVLDTRRDWRFKMNPLVVEHPNVQFFAAAPLRTSEGYNIGALCIMDDQSHPEFTPRQKHTLKEFAAIVMREMELWRDKIQLRIRERIQNSMEQFTRECLEIDNEESIGTQGVLKAGSMDRVYERAAKLVKKTLDVEGATVMDVSHFDVLETTKAEGAISIVCHHGDCLPGEAQGGTTTHHIPTDEYSLFMDFFSKYPEGKIAEGIIPKCFRSILPTRIQHALIVPIFNIDKRPFALLCAYNTADHVKPFLEGHELSYLRAIGVIILSAVLKRRMILADKSKSLFISNISHELRTPLHGILAAAELLGDTELDDNQSSFLRTVQACGTSLVETVNHVLDFTKLSGNSKSGGVENVIHPSMVDLMQLVEEAVEGCWIGHRARLPASSEIGSVYAPPSQGSQLAFARTAVETVIDVGLRNKGWQLVCEKGGIRRVLMNLIGNSLKFTSNGYVHITLREIPNATDASPGKARIELAVIDTGKGISKEFLKNQLFHPFSQENPLQSGTGLGLAIVNSIIRSESVNGQVEVSSTEGVGTEIRITFDAAFPEDEQPSEIDKLELQGKQPTVSMIGFDGGSKGTVLLREVLEKYFKDWWGFEIVSALNNAPGDIIVLNENTELISQAIESKDILRPFVLLTSSRADSETMAKVYEFERLGGFCRLVSKPAGPSRLRQVLKGCVHIVHFRESSQHQPPPADPHRTNTLPLALPSELIPGQTAMARRLSQETGVHTPSRPRMSSRSKTVHPILPDRIATPSSVQLSPPQEYPSSPGDTTINVGAGGTLLKSSIGSWDRHGHRARVLVVEDNQILRDLLIRWLGNRGYEFQDATDGREGVTAFEASEHIDVVLVDLSMPVLDGIAATAEIREIEAKRIYEHAQSAIESDPPRPVKILALTGMSSLEDKRRAFEAGVDGYLVKPVAFKTLDAMFHQMGIS